jgi:hypothetical protein
MYDFRVFYTFAYLIDLPNLYPLYSKVNKEQTFKFLIYKDSKSAGKVLNQVKDIQQIQDQQQLKG